MMRFVLSILLIVVGSGYFVTWHRHCDVEDIIQVLFHQQHQPQVLRTGSSSSSQPWSSVAAATRTSTSEDEASPKPTTTTKTSVADNIKATKTNNYTYDDYLFDVPEKLVASAREYELRQTIFDANMEMIRQFNNDKKNQQQLLGGHTLGINDFMDRFSHELPQPGYDKSQHPAWNTNPIDASILAMSDSESTPATSSSSTSSRRTHELDYWSLLSELTFDGDDESTTTNNNENNAISLLPKHVDWRIDGKTGKPLATPVKYQGSCGSCWAFATTAALETSVALTSPNQTLMSLSMQELVSCVPNPNHCGGTGGCGGSTAELALDFVAVRGLVDEWHFGYQSFHESGHHHQYVPCKLHDEQPASTTTTTGLLATSAAASTTQQSLSTNNNSNNAEQEVSKFFEDAIVTVHGYVKLPSNNYTALMHAVAKFGPIIVNVAATPWRFYDQGVFTPRGHSIEQTDINHVAVLMGYGTDEVTGEDYWLVRNSYGPLWGEDGYIRLERVDPRTLANPDADCGMDVRPADGIACTVDGHHHRHIRPPNVKVCGTSGILFDPVVPIGARIIHHSKNKKP